MGTYKVTGDLINSQNLITFQKILPNPAELSPKSLIGMSAPEILLYHNCHFSRFAANFYLPYLLVFPDAPQ